MPSGFTHMIIARALNFGSPLKEIHGGHFENLGLYELIRCKCRYIIVSDASADKDWKFNDLAKIIEMARLDFGADIDINASELIPDKKNGRDADKFIKILKTYTDEHPEKHKINALLFGHNHNCDIWNGQIGIPRCYDGGSSTRKGEGEVKHRVINLSLEPVYDYDGNFLSGFQIP